jgi:hypothetical protein
MAGYDQIASNQQSSKWGNAMLAWLRDLTSRERRTMLACWGGWTLDGFDQQLYSYVVPTVIAVWGMSTGAAGTIGTVTVVTSSFGGWFAGALADRLGIRAVLRRQEVGRAASPRDAERSIPFRRLAARSAAGGSPTPAGPRCR